MHYIYLGITQWNDKEAPSKVYMSALQIGNKIFDKSQDNPDTLGYAIIGIFWLRFYRPSSADIQTGRHSTFRHQAGHQ